MESLQRRVGLERLLANAPDAIAAGPWPFDLPSPAYEQIEPFRRAAEGVDGRTRTVALEVFLKAFRDRFDRWLQQPEPDFLTRSETFGAPLRRLQECGVAAFKANANKGAELANLARPLTDGLETALAAAERPTFRESQELLDPAEHPTLFELIGSILERTGVFAVASAYARRPLRLKSIAIQVNTARATRLRYGEIDAGGLPAMRTAYLHIDSALWPHVKTLVYLDQMRLDAGPFRYVHGSHRWANPFEIMVRTTNDKLRMSPEMFMALPPPFRAIAEFGGHLDDGGADARRLLSLEQPLLDDGSNIILFDYHGVHRGGFVRQGVRRILQCTFEAA